MICPQCKSKEFKTSTELDDAGDVERVTCANETCMYILKEELLVDRGDGTKQRRSRSVKPEDQPGNFSFSGASAVVDDGLLSADAMMMLALQTQEETVGKRAKEIAKTILEECAKNVLDGEHTYLIGEEDSPPGAVITQAVKELKDRGYKVKKTPSPGKGTEIFVKWPTKKTTSKRRKKQDVEVAPPTVVGRELTPKQQQQAEEKARRKAALKKRSDLPR